VTDFNELSRNGWFYDFVFSSAVLWEQDTTIISAPRTRFAQTI
jgi:hypothetical protein